MIYVFGNSHAHFFTDSPPPAIGMGVNSTEHFQSFSLGPVIAYNFFEHHFPIMIDWINKLSVTENDKIVIAVGEVDCRWHLPKQAELQKKPINDIVHECIDRLFRVHLHLKENGYQVIGWGGHPSTTSGHNDDPSNPVYGDCLSRNKISLEWSDYLGRKCKENDMEFISIIKDLINVDGMTRMEYYKDYCHLDTPKLMPLVINKFRDQGLL